MSENGKKNNFSKQKDYLLKVKVQLLIGVGGKAPILGYGFKSMASPFLSQDIGINELNSKFY